ncbi:MAG: hypothetical protein QM651_19325 [Rhodoblastus sp.]
MQSCDAERPGRPAMRRLANVGLRPDRPIERVSREVEIMQVCGSGVIRRRMLMSLPRVRFLERPERPEART